MTYTVTFYGHDTDGREIVATVHHVPRTLLAAYTSAPGRVLAAARTIAGYPRASGYRVADPKGIVVLDYDDKKIVRS